jgi:Peptidase family M48
VIARALASLARQLRAQRAFVRRLPVLGTRVVHGHRVHVLPGEGLVAFCAGLRTPAVYASEGTLRTASESELRAILAHEEHHRARRDPLRLLLARVVADALRPLPPFATLAERQETVADLAADAATVDALGDRRPLAAAFLRFATVAPERVDRLVRTDPAQTVPLVLLAGACLALAGLAVSVGPLHGAVPHALEGVEFALLLVPACLAARRAEACVRPLP